MVPKGYLGKIEMTLKNTGVAYSSRASSRGLRMIRRDCNDTVGFLGSEQDCGKKIRLVWTTQHNSSEDASGLLDCFGNVVRVKSRGRPVSIPKLPRHLRFLPGDSGPLFTFMAGVRLGGLVGRTFRPVTLALMATVLSPTVASSTLRHRRIKPFLTPFAWPFGRLAGVVMGGTRLIARSWCSSSLMLALSGVSVLAAPARSLQCCLKTGLEVLPGCMAL